MIKPREETWIHKMIVVRTTTRNQQISGTRSYNNVRKEFSKSRCFMKHTRLFFFSYVYWSPLNKWSFYCLSSSSSSSLSLSWCSKFLIHLPLSTCWKYLMKFCKNKKFFSVWLFACWLSLKHFGQHIFCIFITKCY